MESPITFLGRPRGHHLVFICWLFFLFGCALEGGDGEENQNLGFSNPAEDSKAPPPKQGNTREAALNQGNLCLKLQRNDDFVAARDCYQEVLVSLRQVGTANDLATVLNNQGGVFQKLGKPEQARRNYFEALTIRRTLGERRKEAVTLNNLGSLERFVGRWQEAFAHYGNALTLQQEVGDLQAEAKTHNNIGYAYLTLGDLDRALPFLERSLGLRKEVGDRRGQAVTLNNLAFLYHQRGLPAKAIAFRKEALALRQALGDRGGQARALLGLARGHRALGDSTQALHFLEQALALYGETGDRPGMARVLRERGELFIDLKRLEEAMQDLHRTLSLQREIHSHTGVLPTLVALARAEKQRGETKKALAFADEAVNLLDTLRASVGSPQMRATFLSSRRLAHALHVELLMELHRQEPSKGHHRDALASAERARARALLDLLVESEIDLIGTAAPALRQRRSALEGRLRLLIKQRQSLVKDRANESGANQLRREIDVTLAGLDQVEAEIRSADPQYSELVRPRPMDVEAMQDLLDRETTLLYFSLGEWRSYLWRVTQQDVEIFELPPRSSLEEEARRTHLALSTVESGAVLSSLREGAKLSEMLLGQVVHRLTTPRLVLILDGALHYVPFAALPLPEIPPKLGEALGVERFEVVSLPSASSLRRLRKPHRVEEAHPPRTLAVFADPVFNREDRRLAHGSGLTVDDSGSAGVEDEPSSSTPHFRNLARLAASTLEAESIAALLPAEKVWLGLGPEAQRQRVLEPFLADFQFLHFATHGFIDGERPSLSGLMLSRFDQRGAPQEGFLGLRDIYNLELRADLVVLSGCRTALGKGVRGEGLVGLTRGFFHAGVPRVIASLWPVEDRATSALMASFYKALLLDGQSPGAALRAAQLEIRQERRWRDPYYWGAFVLQGDWRVVAEGKG